MTRFLQLIAVALVSLFWLTRPGMAEDSTGFLFVNATVTDFERLGTYGRALPPIYAKYGGTYVVSGGVGRNVEVLDGEPAFQSVIFAQFDSLEDVESFWWSEDYRAVVPLREGEGRFDVLGLEGTGTEPYKVVNGVQPAYHFSLITVKDPAKLPAYYEAMADLMSESPGRLIAVARPDAMSTLEGPEPVHVVEIASWPSMAALKAFVADPRFQAASKLRAEATESIMLAAEPMQAPN